MPFCSRVKSRHGTDGRTDTAVQFIMNASSVLPYWGGGITRRFLHVIHVFVQLKQHRNVQIVYLAVQWYYVRAAHCVFRVSPKSIIFSCLRNVEVQRSQRGIAANVTHWQMLRSFSTAEINACIDLRAQCSSCIQSFKVRSLEFAYRNKIATLTNQPSIYPRSSVWCVIASTLLRKGKGKGKARYLI